MSCYRAPMPIFLYDKATGKKLVEISADERQQLIDSLEEEHEKDVDYYLDSDVLDFLADKLSPEFLTKLQTIVPPAKETESEEIDDSNGIEVEWREE